MSALTAISLVGAGFGAWLGLPLLWSTGASARTGRLLGGLLTISAVVTAVVVDHANYLRPTRWLEPVEYSLTLVVGPVLLSMGVDPVWLGVMIALNLQTSFLTPPFGFALFYLRGVAPPEVRTSQIYKGVIPFILIQLTMLGILALFPELATWLPDQLYG